MSQNTHLSLRPIQTFYLCQSMTGTCLIKISDVLTLCRSNFKILSGALQATRGDAAIHRRGLPERPEVGEVISSKTCLEGLPLHQMVRDHSGGHGQGPGELPIKEALHIHMTPAEEHFNRDTGLEIHQMLNGCPEEEGNQGQTTSFCNFW